jgi:hypothetical protein
MAGLIAANIAAIATLRGADVRNLDAMIFMPRIDAQRVCAEP